MPWLDKDKVLFIHVPRCGGTSITKHHRVGEKAQQGKNLYYKIGIMYYYYRYRLLEGSNFPFMTIENLIALIEFTVATFLFFFVPGLPLPFVMWTTSTILFLTSTFIWTAPVLMRTDFLRVLLMYFQGIVLCGFGGDTNYLVGTTTKGYLFHLTAERCIRYKYVTLEQMERCSFSIVRNPYSRVVSMYEYNKRFFESFDHFVRDFHAKCMNTYHAKGQTDSVNIYCHVLPMYAYTHISTVQAKRLNLTLTKNSPVASLNDSSTSSGNCLFQVVNTIIKQEQLKRLIGSNWKDSNVPDEIQKALTGIPHANSRSRKIPWQKYFTQETMDLVLDMYYMDFQVFGYELEIPNRPELKVNIKVKIPMMMPQTYSQMSRIPSGNYNYNKVRSETSAGEQTSERSFMLFNGNLNMGKNRDIKIKDPNIPDEVKIEIIPPNKKNNQLVLDGHMDTIKEVDSFETIDLEKSFRTKRSASAFVLRVS